MSHDNTNSSPSVDPSPWKGRRFFISAWQMYRDGFRQMTIGKTLWIIILAKLFIFFVVIKLLFFPNLLHKNFNNDTQRADHVRHELTRPR